MVTDFLCSRRDFLAVTAMAPLTAQAAQAAQEPKPPRRPKVPPHGSRILKAFETDRARPVSTQ